MNKNSDRLQGINLRLLHVCLLNHMYIFRHLLVHNQNDLKFEIQAKHEFKVFTLQKLTKAS